MHSLIIALFAFVTSQVAAHNRLLWPTPRNPDIFPNWDANCENDNRWRPPQNQFHRGQRFQAKWSWNNHRGGFVRFAIVPMGREWEGWVWNKPENIIAMGCHTRSCGGHQGFDSGDRFPCTQDVTIPTHLPDGDYVFHWIVYSMFDSDGNPNKGLNNYFNCANIRIQGGPMHGGPGRCKFEWQGGDREYQRGRVNGPGDTCAYFMRTNNGMSGETVRIDPGLVRGGGRPDEVNWCLANGGLGR